MQAWVSQMLTQVLRLIQAGRTVSLQKCKAWLWASDSIQGTGTQEQAEVEEVSSGIPYSRLWVETSGAINPKTNRKCQERTWVGNRNPEMVHRINRGRMTDGTKAEAVLRHFKFRRDGIKEVLKLEAEMVMQPA